MQMFHGDGGVSFVVAEHPSLRLPAALAAGEDRRRAPCPPEGAGGVELRKKRWSGFEGIFH